VHNLQILLRCLMPSPSVLLKMWHLYVYEYDNVGKSAECYVMDVRRKGKAVAALRHEGVWASGCIDPRSLNLATSWRWVVSFMSRPLYPRGPPPPTTHWIGGWVGPRTGLDGMEKKKFLSLPGLELRPLHRKKLCIVLDSVFWEISHYHSFRN
jgi:hypothetical protein